MNVSQMHIGVNIGVQRIAANVHRGLLPEEVDYFLNSAMTEYIKSQVHALWDADSSIMRQRVTENLRPIIATHSFNTSTASNHIPGARVYDISSLNPALSYYLESRSLIGQSFFNNRWVSHAQMRRYISTADNTPEYRELPVMLEGLSLFVMPSQGQSTIATQFLTYVYNPPVLAISTPTQIPVLPDHSHREIVNIAVNMILEDLKVSRPAGPIQVEGVKG